MSNEPSPAGDDADREAVARAIAENENTCHFAQADAVLRVLSERGRLRDADYDWQHRFDVVDRQYRDAAAALTRERDTLEAQLAGSRAANADLRDERDEARADRDSWHDGYMNLADGAVALTKERDAANARATVAEEQCSMREQALDHLEGQRDAARAEAARLRVHLAHALDCDFPAEIDFRCKGCEAARAALAPAAEAPTKTEGA